LEAQTFFVVLVTERAYFQSNSPRFVMVDGAEKWQKIAKFTNPFPDCNCQK
jgi:hypothetical protein